jgi:hypothetical protein
MPLMLTLILSLPYIALSMRTHPGSNESSIKEARACVDVEQRRGM